MVTTTLAVCGIYCDRHSTENAIESLRASGFRETDIRALFSDQLGTKKFLHKKYLLKAAMHTRLPSRVLWRKKQGFNVPNARWIKEELKSFVMDHLAPASVKEMGLLESSVVAALLQEHFAGQADHSHQIWGLLTLVLWWQQFVKGTSGNA